MTQLLVLAKEPRPGHAKTRLTPPLSPAQAASVARAALLDTLAAVAATPATRRLLVLDGLSHDLPTDGFELRAQSAGGLGDRLDAAFRDAFATCDAPALLVGMDTPQVTAAMLSAAAAQLTDNPSVLGLAEDGGWWALGLQRYVPGLFAGVPMSTDDTGAQQARRLVELGLPPAELDLVRDIDDLADLEAVAAQMPTASRLSRVIAQLPARVVVA